MLCLARVCLTLPAHTLVAKVDLPFPPLTVHAKKGGWINRPTHLGKVSAYWALVSSCCTSWVIHVLGNNCVRTQFINQDTGLRTSRTVATGVVKHDDFVFVIFVFWISLECWICHNKHIINGVGQVSNNEITVALIEFWFTSEVLNWCIVCE